MASAQLVVIGAGPGGYAAAFYAADMGLQVALVDPEANPGGVCLYRGCIPSKALLHVAQLVGEAKHASAWGVTFGEPKIDLDKLRTFKNNVVQKMVGGLGQVSKLRKINYIQGLATFVDPHTLSIDLVKGGKETLTFEHAIIATGSRPVAVPNVSIDSPRVMDSTAALDLPDVPKSLLVVGGGYIGLELGSVYAALGSKVTVVEMTGGLLPGADRDLANILTKRLETTLHKILLNAKVASVTDGKTGLKVRIEGDSVPEAERDQTFDRVLVSVGRRPNSAVPGLDKTKVQIGQRGFITVDASMRTAEPSILAIGDVVGEPMLAHKASHEARVAVETALGHNAVFEPQAIPAVVFTDPEVAWCGLTETEAQKQGRKVEIAKFPWAAIGRAVANDRPDGLTKLVIDPATERVLGVGIVGSGAGELISEGVVAVEMAALASDVALSIHPHPTLSETLMEAAEVFYGLSTHVYRPKKKA
ncbi:MAG TPA: dihydrolipoyl dehydrogenase [Vicinamibacterales bacterium]|nr:dihydrolipoyl dehydrogenase [Vicinamibacterales bacterium]